MQTIAFEAQINEGIIHLPQAYRHWHEGQKVKIIVLSEDENQAVTAENKNNVSCLDMVQGEVGVIVDAPRDLSSNPEYMKGYGE
ncbi:hypothetical protein [Methylobacter sp. S3L5C]|uniref:hypothetical protein n=1 Tax=Methylobacter sp. S3L5C TaxID=2839024 RepID=UPI001FAD65BD|nr:hypothetical protein [Methylobacter sp. S3L5C]UOA09501.1 hypothetical protein KKZ03_04190 [Methylobacter sp. S3L5C]